MAEKTIEISGKRFAKTLVEAPRMPMEGITDHFARFAEKNHFRVLPSGKVLIFKDLFFGHPDHHQLANAMLKAFGELHPEHRKLKFELEGTTGNTYKVPESEQFEKARIPRRNEPLRIFNEKGRRMVVRFLE